MSGWQERWESKIVMIIRNFGHVRKVRVERNVRVVRNAKVVRNVRVVRNIRIGQE